MQNSKIKFIWIALLLLAFTACKDEAPVEVPVEVAAIQGQFVSQDGNPVADITVEATDADGKLFSISITDAEGNFEIQNLPKNSDNAVVSFISDKQVVQQLKLSTVVKLAEEDNSPSKSKKATIFLGGEYDYDATFSVVVIDEVSKKPVPDATVTVATSQSATLEATSNAEGIALFEKIVPGKYNIRIHKNGYKLYEESMLLIFPDGMENFEFKFEITPEEGQSEPDPEDCCISFVYVEAYQLDENWNAQPLNRVETLYLKNVKTGEMISAKTGQENSVPSGVAVFRNVCLGEYIPCVAKNDDYNTKVIHVRKCTDEGPADVARIAFPPEGYEFPAEKCCNNILSINIVDHNGNSIGANATVEVLDYKDYSKILANKKTDANGAIIMDSLCNRETKLDIWVKIGQKQYHAPMTNAPLVNCGQHASITVQVDMSGDGNCCDGSIHLSVYRPQSEWNDGNGTSAKGVTVYLRNAETGEMISQKTDNFGRAIFEGLCRGRYIPCDTEGKPIVNHNVLYINKCGGMDAGQIELPKKD